MRDIMSMYKFSYTFLKVLPYTKYPSLMTTSHTIYCGKKKIINQSNDKEIMTNLQNGNDFYAILCARLNEGFEL